MNKSINIIIIGAGPAGALTAYLLGLKGHKVHMFDKNNSPGVSKICGEYLCPAGYKLLEKIGLEHVLETYPKIYGMKLFAPDNQQVNACFPMQQFGHALSRKKFDVDLISLALETKNVTFYPGICIQTIRKEGESIIVSSNDQEWSGSLLIGADGRQSLVGKWLLVNKKVYHKRVAIHAYLKVRPGIKANQGEMHIFNDGSYCGLNPVNENYWNFSLVCDGKKIKQFNSVKELVTKTVGESKRLQEVFELREDEKEFKISGKITNPVERVGCAEKRAVLIGDAAGFVDPLTGEGIYHALLTAEALSQSIQSHKSIMSAINAYKKIINKSYRQKEIINYFFQWLIRYPILCNFVARILNLKPAFRNTFIGLVGNVYSPMQALNEFLKSIIRRKKDYLHVDHY